MTDTLPPGEKIDLTNCEREPIHILGNIQRFGFLIAVGADWIVTPRQRQPAGLHRRGAAATRWASRWPNLFSEKAVHAIRNRVTLLRGVGCGGAAVRHRADGGRPAVRRGGAFLRRPRS